MALCSDWRVVWSGFSRPRASGTRAGTALHQRARVQHADVRLGGARWSCRRCRASGGRDGNRETDALLLNGDDPLYLHSWMRESGLTNLLPSLEVVYVGLSAGSMVMAPRTGESFVGWRPPGGGGDETAIKVVNKVVNGAVEVVSEGQWKLFGF